MDGRIVLERYALLEELGSGGFGAVWLARDERLERLVAVKRIPVASPSAAARAEREARAAARLSHPAVVALYEAGRDDRAVYLVSELVRGPTLHELVHEGALSDRDGALIGMALCDALDHAHARGVVHRDVKPGNVLVPEAGPSPVVAKLTDFGIARINGDDALTRTGDVVGTLAYMAPEQAEGRGAGTASDVYSLGLVLYEALCGVNPVRGENAAATARNVGMRLPPLRRSRPDLPRALCAAIDAALQPDPALRGSLAALRLALAEALPGLGDEPGGLEPRPPGRRRRLDAPGDAQRWEPSSPPRSPDGPAGESRPRPSVAPADRVAGALLNAAAAAAALSLAAGRPPVDPVTAAGLAAAVTMLLPRLGWLAAVGALVAALAGAGGDAWWTLALAAAPLPVLLPRRPAWWSAPTLAVGLGWLGAAAAWPAIAGRAPTLWSRAVLGAAGFWAAALVGMLAGERLAMEPAPSLSALVRTPGLAGAAVWALAAAALPLLVRGRRAATDVLAAIAWAAALAAGGEAVGARSAVGTAALAALLAVLGGALRRT